MIRRLMPEGTSRLAWFLTIATPLYALIVIAKWGDDFNTWRVVFLVVLALLAALLRFRDVIPKTTLPVFFKWVHLFLALLYFWGAAFGKWAKRGDPDEGVLSSNGGTGFGLIAILLGVAFIVLAIMRLMGKTKVLPGLGVEQLTVILGVVAWMNILAFIVGWLATFEAGTGWGVVVAYFPASLIPQLGAITLSLAEPASGIEEVGDSKRHAHSLATLLGGLGVALFPFLAWVSSGNISLSALEGKTGDSLSGPRLGYILLIFGVVVAVASLMRLRPNGLAEPGPNALLGHALLTAGLVAVAIPLATLISIFRHEANLNAGIGLWLGLLAGLVLVVVALVENRSRGAVAA